MGLSRAKQAEILAVTAPLGLVSQQIRVAHEVVEVGANVVGAAVSNLRRNLVPRLPVKAQQVAKQESAAGPLFLRGLSIVYGRRDLVHEGLKF
jgi:hypothetical protein